MTKLWTKCTQVFPAGLLVHLPSASAVRSVCLPRLWACPPVSSRMDLPHTGQVSADTFSLTPNSWTYNSVEVSWHNLESSQTWCFFMDFLNCRKGGMVFYQVFLLSPLQCTVTYSRNCKRLREFEEIEISSCRGDCELMQEYFGHLDHLRILGLVPLLWPTQGQAPQI
jgi:hypothetical protein